jgi:hypothetical protein
MVKVVVIHCYVLHFCATFSSPFRTAIRHFFLAKLPREGQKIRFYFE